MVNLRKSRYAFEFLQNSGKNSALVGFVLSCADNWDYSHCEAGVVRVTQTSPFRTSLRLRIVERAGKALDIPELSLPTFFACEIPERSRDRRSFADVFAGLHSKIDQFAFDATQCRRIVRSGSLCAEPGRFQPG